MDFAGCRHVPMSAVLLALSCLFCGHHLAESRPQNSTPSHEHRLVKTLFKHYDANVRPRYNSSETVNVLVRFSLQQINDLDEKRQILKISGWLTAEWLDEFLTWDPDEFGGLTSLVVAPRKLWVPKLAIGNSANKLFDGEHYKRFWITVRHTGWARWQPGGVFAISCALDMNFYPFDDQNCTLEIETWVYTADKVMLTNSMTEVGLDTYISHGEWTIIKTQVRSVNVEYRYYVNEYFPEVYCTIYIRRKYTFYFMYILLPCLMLSGVLLMVFLLPAESGEKVSLGVSILVAISVFLLLVASNVPDTSDAVPIIAIYLTYFMMITTLAVALSVLVIKIHFMTPDCKPPDWLRYLAFHILARITCMDYHRRLHYLSLKKQQRELTWELDDMKSQNSTLTPDGPENLELLHHSARRRITSDVDHADGSEATGNNSHAQMGNKSTLGGQQQQQQQQHHPMMSHDGDYVISPSAPKPYNEWKRIAEIIDRSFFWLFLLCIILPTASILGFMRLFKPNVETGDS